jgi:ABC-type Zn2+ transport system substrate-binding protein/surface adhesin
MAARAWDNARDDHHGATMSDTHPIPDEHGSSHAVEGPHGSAADHGGDHGHDDHAHGGDALGPIDWPMWGVGVLGVIVALIVTAGLAAASGFTLAA